jgi:hypothetical protein
LMSVVSEMRSDSEGVVDSCVENETFFFIWRMEGEVVETEGRPLPGPEGGWFLSVGDSAPEEVGVVESSENTESTDERVL